MHQFSYFRKNSSVGKIVSKTFWASSKPMVTRAKRSTLWFEQYNLCKIFIDKYVNAHLSHSFLLILSLIIRRAGAAHEVSDSIKLKIYQILSTYSNFWRFYAIQWQNLFLFYSKYYSPLIYSVGMRKKSFIFTSLFITLIEFWKSDLYSALVRTIMKLQRYRQNAHTLRHPITKAMLKCLIS